LAAGRDLLRSARREQQREEGPKSRAHVMVLT